MLDHDTASFEIQTNLEKQNSQPRKIFTSFYEISYLTEFLTN